MLIINKNYFNKFSDEYSIIKYSGLFDEEWFCKTYPLDDDVDPIIYYLKFGVELGLNPSPDFDTLWYLEEYSDVKKSNMNPFVHYVKYGINEGFRFPKPFNFDDKYKNDYFSILKSGLFDEEWFCKTYSLDYNVDPIIYYLKFGVELSLNPSPDFDTLWYLEEYSDVKKSNMNPFVHYVKYGINEGFRLPKPFNFDDDPEISRAYFYKKVTGKDLNLENPQDFNEKINWLILNRYGRKEGQFTDKYLVKQIVEDMNIGDLHIAETYKIYKDANEINIDELPEKFVLKCNHYSGKVFICRDKSSFDLNNAKIILNKELGRSFSQKCLEYHYDYIEPCIIAEELLEDSENLDLIDYKFYCFEGKTEDLLVCTERSANLKLDHYDINWNKKEFVYKKYMSENKLKKPENFETMIDIAEKLSENHLFVRIDLYNIAGKIYLGEFTFTPGAGIITYYNQNALDYLGSKIDLK